MKRINIALIVCAVAVLAGLSALLVPASAGAAGAVNNTTVQLTNPLTGTSGSEGSIAELVNKIVTMAIGLSGVMALIAFVYGGVLYLMAGVNLDFMKKGKEIMKWAVFGIIIIFSSYAVINFVLTSIVKLK